MRKKKTIALNKPAVVAAKVSSDTPAEMAQLITVMEQRFKVFAVALAGERDIFTAMRAWMKDDMERREMLALTLPTLLEMTKEFAPLLNEIFAFERDINGWLDTKAVMAQTPTHLQ